jgi:tRNA(Ile)-lysidine synthase
LDYAALERAQKFITQPPRSRQSDLLAGLRLEQEGNQLVLASWQIVKIPLLDRDWPSLAAVEIKPLSIPADVHLADGWRFRARMVNDMEVARQQAAANTDPCQAWIDAGALTEGLHLRTRQLGDRFHPLGLDGHSVKLSDFMINAKLPAAARSNWPLVVCGEQIVWVAGLRLAHPYRITEDSQAAIQLILVRSDLAGSAEQEHLDHPGPHSDEPEKARENV